MLDTFPQLCSSHQVVYLPPSYINNGWFQGRSNIPLLMQLTTGLEIRTPLVPAAWSKLWDYLLQYVYVRFRIGGLSSVMDSLDVMQESLLSILSANVVGQVWQCMKAYFTVMKLPDLPCQTSLHDSWSHWLHSYTDTQQSRQRGPGMWCTLWWSLSFSVALSRVSTKQVWGCLQDLQSKDLREQERSSHHAKSFGMEQLTSDTTKNGTPIMP